MACVLDAFRPFDRVGINRDRRQIVFELAILLAIPFLFFALPFAAKHWKSLCVVWVLGGGIFLWYGLPEAFEPRGPHDPYGIGSTIEFLIYTISAAAFLASAIPRTIWIWLKASGQSRRTLWLLHIAGVIALFAGLVFLLLNT